MKSRALSMKSMLSLFLLAPDFWLLLFYAILSDVLIRSYIFKGPS
jgi:hypothetical protein